MGGAGCGGAGGWGGVFLMSEDVVEFHLSYFFSTKQYIHLSDILRHNHLTALNTDPGH